VVILVLYLGNEVLVRVVVEGGESNRATIPREENAVGRHDGKERE